MAATSVAAIGALVASLHSPVGDAATPVSAGPVLAIESVHVSAAGMLLDLRYRVIDPARAQRALGPKIRPKLIDERTGIEMSVPTTAKLGSLRQTQGQQRGGRSYFVLFVNTARLAPGARVRAELGELVYPNLLVQ